MNKRLFVGGLPWAVNDQQLNEIFAKVGTVVSANVIIDKFSGRSKGFGFVEMSTEEEAQKAIDELNDTEVDGRKIIVNEARPLEERPRNDFHGGGRGGHGGGGRRDDNRRGGFSRGGRSKRW